MKTMVFALISLALGIGGLAAKDLPRADLFFRQANDRYEKGEFREAADLYRKSVDEGVVNSILYYNYANSLFRVGKLGQAILYYEKAAKLAPNDEDIRFNLRYVSAQTVDKNPAPEQNLLTRVLWALHSSFSINQGLWAALGLFSGLFLLAAFRSFAPPGAHMPISLIGVLTAAILLLLSPSLVYKIWQQETVTHAIVLTQATSMFSGPGENFQVLMEVHEGTKFEIAEQKGAWAAVKLLNGRGGFVKLADLGKI